MSDGLGGPDSQRWEAELKLRSREIDLKERELGAREEEVALAKRRERSERWRNPLTVAVLAAAVAGFSNAYIALKNNDAQYQLAVAKASADRDLERSRIEAQRILEVVKTGNPNQAAENLGFLLELGLIDSDDLRKRVEAWRKNPNRARVYLPAGDAAVAEFQRRVGMPADGIAGPATRARMEEEARRRSQGQ